MTNTTADALRTQAADMRKAADEHRAEAKRLGQAASALLVAANALEGTTRAPRGPRGPRKAKDQ